MKPQTIHEAVDQLVQKQRIRVPRDDGQWTWKTTPSLWELLTDSIAQTGGTGSGTSSAARLPISATVIDLIAAIETTVREAAASLNCRRDTTPDALRAVAATIVGDPDEGDAADWWTDQIIAWCRDIRACLRLDPERPRWARGVPCPACGETHATGTDGVEVTRVPALAITWGGPDDDRYHADDEWLVRGVTCGACGVSWLRGVELEQLTLGILQANATHETLTEGVA